MSNQNETQRQFERLRSIKRRFNQLVTKLSDAELLADDLILDIAAIDQFLATGELNTQSAPNTFAALRRKNDVREQFRQIAETGAASVVIKYRSDGMADVAVDDGKRFDLPPSLADLLQVLALDSGLTDDGIVGWKRLDEIAILLAKRSGKRMSKHAVTQSIYRLRRELFSRGGVNPFLIQTNRRRGARFALRRQRRPEITCD